MLVDISVYKKVETMTDKEMFDEYEKLMKAARRVKRRLERQGDNPSFFNTSSSSRNGSKRRAGKKKGSNSSEKSMVARKGTREDLAAEVLDNESVSDRQSNRSSNYSKY